MAPMIVNGVEVADEFAEAFDMAATGVIITAPTARWAEIAARTMTGFATSVIACGVEAGIDRMLAEHETPDGRPGVRVLVFGFSAEGLGPALRDRVGQCVLTAPGSACFAGHEGAERLPLGAALRRFGDGHQIAKALGSRRYWRIPVMDGEFVVEDDTGTGPAIGGGNLILAGSGFDRVLAAAEEAAAAAATVTGVILPFPGGLVRSGSKVGSRYAGLRASTNDAWCPTLVAGGSSKVPPGCDTVLEIVIDGLDAGAIAEAMRRGLHAAAARGPQGGVRLISAGNYGGSLGRHHFHLRDLL